MIFIFCGSQYQPNLKMVVYKEFPHGFLNFDVPNGMKEAKETVRDAAAMLLELLENWAPLVVGVLFIFFFY